MAEEEEDAAAAFRRRIESALATVRAWDADEELLARCRAGIPFAALRGGDQHGPYSQEEDDDDLSQSHRFVQRLARHFQRAVMAWVNAPPCAACGGATVHVTTRGPQTDDERRGGASRVEVYRCSGSSGSDDDHHPETTFPRYNSAARLFETRRGRCGEYANLFGLYCRAVGLETRYVLDWTDHVWTEVRINDSEHWMMVDSCEGVIDECSMYEAGWGKKLSYCVAVGKDHVVDVTPRYTRQWSSDDFQARRRAVIGSERAGEDVLRQINASLQQRQLLSSSSSSPKEVEKLERRLAREQRFLQKERQCRAWEHRYGRGRISGSLAWKAARHEEGTAATTATMEEENPKKHPDTVPSHLYIETYYPVVSSSTTKDGTNNNNNKKKKSSNLTIVLQPRPPTRHEAVVVNGVACAVGALRRALSVVVLDECYLGCILQSRSFSTLRDLADFVVTLPAQRVVVLVGKLNNRDQTSASEETGALTCTKLTQLGGFDPGKVQNGVCFAGQVLAHPDWAFCRSFEEAPNGFVVEDGAGTDAMRRRKLRTALGVQPASVVGRLPENAMPLQTQQLSGHEQKRAAFLSFVLSGNGNSACFGYTTKPGAAVYLLGETAYPFNQVEHSSSTEDETWSSFLLLPEMLVPEEHGGIQDVASIQAPQFEAPLDSNFFASCVGPNLLRGTQSMPTVDALRNTRLVALYFSAHWCGPCRSFTPMLCEMYNTLKDAFPAHGLEIVFVSSDRDANGFRQYYASMPWLSIPFETLGYYKQLLCTTYNVRGIPSLVVLDSLSGQIVVPNTETRQQVMQACNRGDEGIKSMFQNEWLERCPVESKQMLELLAVSCTDTASGENESYGDSAVLRSHLIRSESEETKARMASLVEQLVEDGMEHEEAMEMARQVEDVSAEDESGPELQLEKGALNGILTYKKLDEALPTHGSPSEWASKIANDAGREQLALVLSTALRYLNNCKKSPWTPTFRSFRLSFKVADRITRVFGSLQLLQSLGLTVHGTAEDFVANIPIEADLSAMHEAMEGLLRQYKLGD